jgi:hypothetical protein
VSILGTIEHVAVLYHVVAKNKRALTYRPSQRHNIDTRAVKDLPLARVLLADLEQIWRGLLEKSNIMHYSHFIGVVILLKISAREDCHVSVFDL